MLCSESRFGVDRCVCCAVRVDLVLICVCVVQ